MLWFIILAMIAFFLLTVILPMSIKTIRPTERGLIERFGKYQRFAQSGLVFIMPFAEKLVRVNITEMMVSSEKREIITADSLNAVVDSNVAGFGEIGHRSCSKSATFSVKSATPGGGGKQRRDLS